MFGAGPGGFGSAPVTKALCAVTVSSSILLQAARAARRPVPAYVAAFEQLFVFRHPGELLFGTGLLYYSRLFERQMGSGKYGGFLLGTVGVSCLLEWAASAALRVATPSGPYGLIFANFVTFALAVPPLQKFTLFGRQLSDKVFMYVAGAQLLFSAPRSSIPAGLCGILAGIAYHSNVLGMKRLQLPRVAADFLGRTLGPLLGTRQQRVVVPGAAAEQQASAQHQQQQQQLQQRRRGARAEPNGRPPQVKLSHAATVPVLRRVLRRIAPDAVQELAAGIATIMEALAQLPNASPEALETLVGMGFDSAQAARALQQAHNDIQTALALLL